jgi:uncharacterized membrane protein
MKISLYLPAALLFFTFACANNKMPEPKPFTADCTPGSVTFSGQVSAIIQQDCALSGCHGSGSPYGDFNKYADLKAKVDNGSFRNSVLEQHTPVMPPPGSTELTEAERQTLECWVNDGAPQ